MKSAFRTYFNLISRAIGRLGKWEGRLVRTIVVVCTGLVIFYGNIIFATYPDCDPDELCEFVVPVFAGDQAPALSWVTEWRQVGVLFQIEDIKMATLTEAGRSGALRDPMLASGFIAALVTLWLTLPLEQLYRQMTCQMEQDGLVPREFRAFAEIEVRRRVWAWTVGATIFSIMLLGTINTHGGYSTDVVDQIFLWGSSFLGFAAGHRMGTAFAYGQFARRLREISEAPCLLPSHADGAGGWRRFGEFMAYLAVIMSVPLIWLSTWIFISIQNPEAYVGCFRMETPGSPGWLKSPCDLSYLPFSSYAGWLMLHVPLLAIMLAITFAGLIRPFFRATIPYRKDRARLFSEHVAQLDGPLADALKQWRKARSLEDRRAASKAVGELTSTRESIWALPVVPLRSTVTGVFSVSALYPIVMLALSIFLPKDGELTGAIGFLADLFKSLGL